MLGLFPSDFASLYQQFHSPITELNCGDKCAPYNERGAPFCCDTQHAVPTAYESEWVYLQNNTNLWHQWQSESPSDAENILRDTPPGQVLIECLGHLSCQRDFRSITCRAFPFFPYITRQDEFIGLAYYWEYEDRCWIISNLTAVTTGYRSEFVAAYDKIFEHFPQEKKNFRYYSGLTRRVYGRKHRAIPVLHRNGYTYKITPRNGRMRHIPLEALPKFGLYKIADSLPFSDETQNS